MQVHIQPWPSCSAGCTFAFYKKYNKALLQNMLEELMHWHASMLRSICNRNDHPDMAIQRRLSDLDQEQWRQQRRFLKNDAKQEMKHGEFLAKQRDSGKRKFEDMSATEQQTLEEFETNKSKRRHEAMRVRKLPYFHGEMIR